MKQEILHEETVESFQNAFMARHAEDNVEKHIYSRVERYSVTDERDFSGYLYVQIITTPVVG